MGALDSMAAKFAEAKPLGQNRPFDEFGRYLQRIQSVRLANSFKHGGEFCAIEKRVVRVEPEQGYKSNHVGQEIVDLINNYGNQAKVYGSKTRGFIAAITGEAFEQVTFANFMAACADSQPLNGMLVEVDNHSKMVEVKKGANAGKQEARPSKQYVRGYSVLQVKAILTAEEIAKFYPNGELDRLIAGLTAAYKGAGMNDEQILAMSKIA